MFPKYRKIQKAPFAPIFHSLKILKIEDILHHNVLTLVYKVINKLSASYFHNSFQLNTFIHEVGTCQATTDVILKPLKNTKQASTIKYFGFKLWTTLPLFIHSASSIFVFRSKFKSHMIN